MRHDGSARSAVDEIIDEALDCDQGFGLRPEARTARQRRQPAHPPGSSREFCNGVAQRGNVAALKTIGNDDDSRAARIAAKARHGEKCLQRIADPGPAIPVADQMRRRVQRLLAPLEPKRPGDAGKARAEGEHFGMADRLPQCMRSGAV